MPLENRVYTCDKCFTKLSKCWFYNGRWLCKAASCIDEEMEKDSGKHIRDWEDLNRYRHDVARSHPQIPSRADD